MRHVSAKWFGEDYEIIVCWGEFVINKIRNMLRLCLNRFFAGFGYNFNGDLVVFEFALDQRLQLIVKCDTRAKTRRIKLLNLDWIYFYQTLQFRVIFKFTIDNNEQWTINGSISLTFYLENVLFVFGFIRFRFMFHE